MAGYILRDGEKSVVLRADQIDRLLGRGDGDAALLYLCLLRNDGAIEPQRLTTMMNEANSEAYLQKQSKPFTTESGPSSLRDC